jgi:hypothetical protein
MRQLLRKRRLCFKIKQSRSRPMKENDMRFVFFAFAVLGAVLTASLSHAA